MTLTTLAAEIHAERTIGEFKSRPVDWIGSFLTVLSNLGWIVTARELKRLNRPELPLDTVLDQLGEKPLVRRLARLLAKSEDWPESPRFVGVVQCVGGSIELSAMLLLITQGLDSPVREEDRLAASLTMWQGILDLKYFEQVKPELERRLRH